MITPLSPRGLQVEALPAFADNYLWLIHDHHDAAVVDPGDAAVVEAALQQRRLRLRHILVTHHHMDHVGGVPALKSRHGARVHGPALEADRIGHIDHPLTDGDRLRLDAPALTLSVIAVPGHTLGHIAYYASTPAPGWLFCGDTLFCAGCGRLFEGSPGQMLDSLRRLAALPEATEVYCAHEYTLANLAFAAAADAGNPDVARLTAEVSDLRRENRPSLPSTVARELRINPFLRVGEPNLVHNVSSATGIAPTASAVAIFAAMRRWKDGFRLPAA